MEDGEQRRRKKGDEVEVEGINLAELEVMDHLFNLHPFTSSSFIQQGLCTCRTGLDCAKSKCSNTDLMTQTAIVGKTSQMWLKALKLPSGNFFETYRFKAVLSNHCVAAARECSMR